MAWLSVDIRMSLVQDVSIRHIYLRLKDCSVYQSNEDTRTYLQLAIVAITDQSCTQSLLSLDICAPPATYPVTSFSKCFT